MSTSWAAHLLRNIGPCTLPTVRTIDNVARSQLEHFGRKIRRVQRRKRLVQVAQTLQASRGTEARQGRNILGASFGPLEQPQGALFLAPGQINLSPTDIRPGPMLGVRLGQLAPRKQGEGIEALSLQNLRGSNEAPGRDTPVRVKIMRLLIVPSGLSRPLLLVEERANLGVNGRRLGCVDAELRQQKQSFSGLDAIAQLERPDCRRPSQGLGP